jgi:protein phosphatase 1 regulatory subunit 10
MRFVRIAIATSLAVAAWAVYACSPATPPPAAPTTGETDAAAAPTHERPEAGPGSAKGDGPGNSDGKGPGNADHKGPGPGLGGGKGAGPGSSDGKGPGSGDHHGPHRGARDGGT